jgi:hypothetical protein
METMNKITTTNTSSIRILLEAVEHSLQQIEPDTMLITSLLNIIINEYQS